MATHSSIHTGKIPWTEEPGRLQSKALQRVGHTYATKAQHTAVSFPAQCGFGKCLLCGVLVYITTFKHATEKKEKAKL